MTRRSLGEGGSAPHTAASAGGERRNPGAEKKQCRRLGDFRDSDGGGKGSVRLDAFVFALHSPDVFFRRSRGGKRG